MAVSSMSKATFKQHEEEATGNIKTDSDQSMFDSPHESSAESAEEESESEYYEA